MKFEMFTNANRDKRQRHSKVAKSCEFPLIAPKLGERGIRSGWERLVAVSCGLKKDLFPYGSNFKPFQS
jgi:hypothetical protein